MFILHLCFWCQSCQLSRILGQSKLSNNIDSEPFHRQVLNILTALFYYRPQRSCGQGYVFTGVCDSVHFFWGGFSGERPPGPILENPTPPLGTKENPPGTKEKPPPRTKENPPPDQGETPPRTKENPPLQHTVTERPVRILLECILVSWSLRIFDVEISFLSETTLFRTCLTWFRQSGKGFLCQGSNMSLWFGNVCFCSFSSENFKSLLLKLCIFWGSLQS